MSRRDDLLALLRGRRSVRRFQARPVERRTLDRLIEAAGWAPSAGNRQDWFFSLVTTPEAVREMAEAVRLRWEQIVSANPDLGFIEEVRRYSTHFHWFGRAPVVVVVSARRPDSLLTHLLGETAAASSGSAASAAMAAQNLMLAAHALGLGSCCLTGAVAAGEELARLAGLARRQEIVCLVALGWPAEEPPPPTRKPLSEIRRFVE